MTDPPTTSAMVGMVGNLTDDPELLTAKSGRPWMKARISVKPFVPGAGEQPAQFFDVVAFGSLAENAGVTLHKGDRVVVTGKVEEDRWTGSDGIERVTTKIIAEGLGLDLRFRGSKSGNESSATPSAVSSIPESEECAPEGRPIPNELGQGEVPF